MRVGRAAGGTEGLRQGHRGRTVSCHLGGNGSGTEKRSGTACRLDTVMKGIVHTFVSNCLRHARFIVAPANVSCACKGCTRKQEHAYIECAQFAVSNSKPKGRTRERKRRRSGGTVSHRSLGPWAEEAGKEGVDERRHVMGQRLSLEVVSGTVNRWSAEGRRKEAAPCSMLHAAWQHFPSVTLR